MEKEEPYSNREIKSFFGEFKEQLDRIEAQTTRTNGKVRKLEIWRAYSAGAILVIIMIGLPILGFLSMEVFKLATLSGATTTNNTINK